MYSCSSSEVDPVSFTVEFNHTKVCYSLRNSYIYSWYGEITMMWYYFESVMYIRVYTSRDLELAWLKINVMYAHSNKMLNNVFNISRRFFILFWEASWFWRFHYLRQKRMMTIAIRHIWKKILYNVISICFMQY